MTTTTTGRRARMSRWHLQLRSPLYTAMGTIAERRGIHLEVRNAFGEVGLGDVAPLPGFSLETLDEAEAVLQRLITRVDILRTLPAAPEDRIEWLAGQELPSSAAHGIEQAVLTLRALPINGSLASLLAAEQGRTPRPTVPTHRLWLGAPPVRGRRVDPEVHSPLPRPFAQSKLSAIKIKVGADLAAAEALVATVRQEVGDAMELRVDVNGAWSPDTAAEGLRCMARHGVAWVEQPIAADVPDVLEHMAELRARRLGPGLAADESVRSTEDARAVITAGAADAIVIKPMFCGGLAAALEIGRLAAAAHLAVSVTTVLESPVGAAAARAVAAAMPGRLISCSIETRSFFVDPSEHDDGDDDHGDPR